MRSWIVECLARQRGKTMQPYQSEKAIETKHVPTKTAPSSAEIGALIAHLDRNSEAIMRGRTFTDDSATTLREIREERTAAQSAR